MCWNDDRTAILRTAATITAGERVHVTLHDGELNCVVETTDSTVDEAADNTDNTVDAAAAVNGQHGNDAPRTTLTTQID